MPQSLLLPLTILFFYYRLIMMTKIPLDLSKCHRQTTLTLLVALSHISNPLRRFPPSFTILFNARCNPTTWSLSAIPEFSMGGFGTECLDTLEV
jgi:hypothetical protein